MFGVSKLSFKTIASANRAALLRPSVRCLSTVKASNEEGNAILIAQRKNRPCSPHLTIYKMQLTAVMSSFHRITGVGLAAGFYGVTAAYGLGLTDTATLVSLFSSLPVIAQVGLKTIAALPFSFHIWNGVRHLIWDSGYAVNNSGVYKTGYAVCGLAAVTALALLLL